MNFGVTAGKSCGGWSWGILQKNKKKQKKQRVLRKIQIWEKKTDVWIDRAVPQEEESRDREKKRKKGKGVGQRIFQLTVAIGGYAGRA